VKAMQERRENVGGGVNSNEAPIERIHHLFSQAAGQAPPHIEEKAHPQLDW
jgi:hypothetical protein